MTRTNEKKMDGKILDVYIAGAPRCDVDLSLVRCDKRRRELEGVRCEDTLREKFFVWRLLEYALEKSFGLSLDEINPRKEESGKWVADGVFFSLSHSRGALAVLVSDEPCGVDIEGEVPPRAKNFAEKVLNERELSELLTLPERERGRRLLELWSMKESLFKMRGGARFSPRDEDTSRDVTVMRASVGGERRILSVASAILEQLRIFNDTGAFI